MIRHKKNKDIKQEKVEFSIDVTKTEHPLGDINKQFFWVIVRTSNGCSSVYTSGWAANSEEAWKNANESYGRIVSYKNE